ncbi:MAG TPA: sensor histidine kinase [Myxococcota bacterium]|nr:sensor histidine kinase [Myxococcota bacterium]
MLLREVHHRVKNNLQVMVSLLDMQGQRVTDPQALEVLMASKGRVQAMTLIHQKLYQQDNIAALSLGTYLRQLVEGVRGLFPGGAGVETEYALVEGEFGIDTAVPLGLILNELVTNAFKYAYTGREGGRLRLALRRLDGEQYALEVEDDGPGLPEGMDVGRSKTLGLQLVMGLARQLRGQVEVGRSELGGCRISIQFTPIKAVS